MTALNIDVIRCAACGAEPAVAERDLRIASQGRDVSAAEAVARACARHLMLACETRYMGHPAFGLESRWNRYVHPTTGTVTLEISWTGPGWGMPFLLYNVPGFKPGVHLRSEWSLD